MSASLRYASAQEHEQPAARLASARVRLTSRWSRHRSASTSLRVAPAATPGHGAVRAGPLAEIDRAGHAIDHPIRSAEGAHLKCLLAIAP